jgi:hypothetical protein
LISLSATSGVSLAALGTAVYALRARSIDATAERCWSVVAGNLDRFARGEPLENIVLQT